MNRRQTFAQGIIITTGVLLWMTTVAVLVSVMQLTSAIEQNRGETQLNREIGCINRHINGDKVAPACNQYIDKYLRGSE